MSTSTQFGFGTLCVHGAIVAKTFDNEHEDKLEKARNALYGAVAMPIFQTATFVHTKAVLASGGGYSYSRMQNPTRERTEDAIAALEGGADAIGFSSGLAAISTLMELFMPGDHIIAASDLYGGTHRLFSHISQKNGLKFSFIDDCTEISVLVTPKTKAIFIETPTNPMMNVMDIAAAATVAKEKELLLIVDNTFLTPYFQKPLKLGADIVVHSATKYLGGHNDTLAGFLVLKNEDIAKKLRFLAKTTGGCLAPFDSFLIARGIKTLALRMEKSQKTAIEIARWLQTRPDVTQVHYPGLTEHPQFEVSKRQASGFGAMLSFDVKNRAVADRVLEGTKIIQYAESLGGTETLLTYPCVQTHADVPIEQREKLGITDCLLRLSIGIEDVNDLINDLSRVF
jgi:cystathionine beta-lyase/cystathionine gamma-synthase